MYCTQCGNALSDGDKFCSRCGKAISEQVVQGASTITPPPVITDTHAPSSTKVSPDSANGANVDPLKAFAKLLAISIWWKTALALLLIGLSVGVFTGSPGPGGLMLMVLLYILTLVYVPYQSIEAALKRPEANVSVSPTPHSNQDLVALAWGFIWRFTAVSIAFALPLKMTGYDPDEIEGLIVSSILMLAVCWVAAMWLVFSPQGKSRFQATLSEPVANNSD